MKNVLEKICYSRKRKFNKRSKRLSQKEGKGLANDLSYLKETKIPGLESKLKYSQEKIEDKK